MKAENKEKVFEGLPFEDAEVNGEKVKKGSDGCFYDITHVGNVFIIEVAENEAEAKKYWYQDAYIHDDDLPMDVLIPNMRNDLLECLKQSAEDKNN